LNFLLVNYEYPPLGGGAGNATMFIARSMAQAGHRPVVLTSAFGDLPEHEQTGGVTVHRVKARRRSPDRSDQLQMASFTAAALRVVRRIADAERIDAAIAFFTIPSAPVTWWLWRTTRVPYAISLRGGDVPGHVPGLRAIHHALTPFRRTMLRRAIAVVANSDSLARLAQRADRLPVRMIPNGVDTTYFRPASTRRERSDARFRILFVGRVHAEKNIDLLLHAVAALAPEHRQLVEVRVVGDGPARPQLERAAAALGTTDQVKWLGWRSKEEVAQLYREADCLVNPSSYEGMPNTVLEAMAASLPVIASDVAGNNEVITPNKTGLLFDLASPSLLSACLTRLIADPGLAHSLGTAARECVIATYSWDHVAEQYVALFRECAVRNVTTPAAQSC